MKHLLITGATGAIGGAIARAFRRYDVNARLSLVDLEQRKLDATALSLGADAKGFAWDLSNPDALPERLRALEAERGPVDILVNCAGIMEIRSLTATDWPLASRLLEVDLISPLRLMALVSSAMASRRMGAIVNVSSMAGVTPLRGCVYYGAAKAGLAMASEIARLDLEPFGVHVITVYPGPVRSALERRARAQAGNGWVSQLLPTGDPEPLATEIVEAYLRKRARVVFPSFYRLANRFPKLASAITRSLSPTPIDV